jgi:hypothetical protein
VALGTPVAVLIEEDLEPSSEYRHVHQCAEYRCGVRSSCGKRAGWPEAAKKMEPSAPTRST